MKRKKKHKIRIAKKNLKEMGKKLYNLSEIEGDQFALNKFGDEVIFNINPLDKETYDTGLIVIKNTDIKRGFSLGFLKPSIKPGKDFINYLETSKYNLIYHNGETNEYMTIN